MYALRSHMPSQVLMVAAGERRTGPLTDGEDEDEATSGAASYDSLFVASEDLDGVYFYECRT